MLKHEVIGPMPSGDYLVCYPTPGCSVPTVACECRTEKQARIEVQRLDKQQIQREKGIRWDQELRGVAGVYPALEGM